MSKKFNQLADQLGEGWTGQVAKALSNCLDTFKTSDAYMMEKALKRLHPENHNVKAKIRQQLQILRDKGLLTSDAKGIWKKVQ